MLTSHRLQIYLPPEDYEALKKRAHSEDASLASVVREAVHAYVAKSPEDRIREGYAQIQGLIGIGRDMEGKSDVSTEHDDYLDEITEEKRRKWRRKI